MLGILAVSISCVRRLLVLYLILLHFYNLSDILLLDMTFQYLSHLLPKRARLIQYKIYSCSIQSTTSLIVIRISSSFSSVKSSISKGTTEYRTGARNGGMFSVILFHKILTLSIFVKGFSCLRA